MMRRSFASIVAAVILGLGLTLGLVWSLNSPARGLAAAPDADAPVPTESRAPGAVRTVCPAGPPTCDHAVIQEAVDAAVDGDVIKVATGVYTGVQGRPAPAGYSGPSIITQVVYLSKSLTLEGGYTTTDWSVSNPISYPTTLDAQGQGRAILITGTISVTLDSLHITGGDATGLGGGYFDYDVGGGIGVVTANALISGCWFSGNIADFGGGLGMIGSDAEVYGNTFGNNTAIYDGGGLSTSRCNLTLEKNTFITNTCEQIGGGLSLDLGTASLIENKIVANRSDLLAGGMSLSVENLILEGNSVLGNRAGQAGGAHAVALSATVSGNLFSGNYGEMDEGGLTLWGDDILLDGNRIVENSTGGDAGGLLLRAENALLRNNLIADNGALLAGGGLVIESLHNTSAAINLAHNTIARNQAGEGSGILVVDWGEGDVTVALTNTVLVSHTVGISVSAGNTVTLQGTLWGSGAWANGVDWGGAGTIVTGTVNVWGDPVFVGPDSGDYHIGRGSAAIDAGVDSGVPVDMDGEPRPAGMEYDIGADEAQALVRYVATDGADSGDCSTPAGRCLTVQYAVDQAWAGDEVRVATGVYTGVHGRPAPAGYSGPSIITQVVYISKSITVRGGYTTTDWTRSNPISYPTTLDAERQGRVLVISGTITATVEGLRITGGDAAGLGGVLEYYNLGGGVCVMTATAVLNDNWILNNRADYGGGLGLMGSHAWVSGNTFTSNTVGYEGGGLYAEGGELVVDGNTFITNTAGWDGGGLFVFQTDSNLMGNTFLENRADMWGGGVGAYLCPEITLEGNQIVSNTAAHGGGLIITVISTTLRGNLISTNYGEIGDGGLFIGTEQVTLDGNLIVGNSTDGRTGGLSLGADNATLSNNVIADNRALVAGGGLVIDTGGYWPTHANLVNNTIARNQAGDGTGILVEYPWGGAAVLTLTNTVLVSHTVGISVSAGYRVTLQGTLWGSGAWANGVDWGGAGTILIGTVNVWGDPAFVDPDSGDYHIAVGSAAIDAGVDAGVGVDIDGELRPVGMGYDIGADEYPAGLWLTKSAFPDPGQTGAPLTYTIQATNNGLVPLTALLTDILPIQVAPTGLLTWTLDSLLPGDSWTETVVVTVAAGYSGLLTNVLQATSVEGFSGAYTVTTPAYLPVAAEFTAVPTTGVAPLTVTFTNLSTGSYSSSLWDYGDGATSTLDSPTHVYSAGLYTVTLSVSGPGGSDSETKVGYITVYEPPTAEFSGDPTNGPAPLTVDFANLSTGDYDSCTWDFGDGIGFSNSCEDPSYQYTTAGVFAVTLSVSGPGGSNSETKVGYITAYEPPTAEFSADPTSGPAPLTVGFLNLSSGDYDTCTWDFGDGIGFSNSCGDPRYEYAAVGVYTVTLSVSGPGGSDSETKAGYITVRYASVIYLPLVMRNHPPVGEGADEARALVRYVATDGADSGDCSTPAGRCLTVQYAVDQAWEGDEVRVATGVYTGVHGRPAPAGYSGPSIITQVVYISKSITVRGGYSTTDWTTSNPMSYPTTLDAERQGRVLVISGTNTTTVEGLRITGGDTAGLPSSGWGGGNGAGLFVGQAAVTVANSHIFDNKTAAVAKGAGVYVISGDGFVFSRNSVYSNTVSGDYGFGAGLYVEQSDRLVIISNTITGNRGLTGPLGAGAGGGGVSIGPGADVLLSHNVVSGNHVAGAYGGVAVWADKVTLSDNVVANNSAGYFAGGLGIDDSEMVTVSNNLIVGNRAGGLEAREGAGVVVFRSSQVTFTNNVVADNHLITGGVGSGVYVKGSQCNLVHNTIARNGGGDGSGIHVADWDSIGSTVSLTDTILVSHTVGITVAAGSTATMEATLWGSGAWANGTDWEGAGTILTGTVNVWGDPVFVDPDSGDYHIGPGSAAIDAGVDAGVLVDMDGEARPVGDGYDIGADEVQALVRYVATDGADSGDCSTPAGRCLTVQYAVDQAWEGDEIRVASGVYTGVNSYGDQSQQVYISKSLTMRGGYTTAFDDPPGPDSNPTTLDAQGQGRVVLISGAGATDGTITATISGFRLTGGDATGLGFGGLYRGLDAGGGILIISATAILSDNYIVGNHVGEDTIPYSCEGGGLYAVFSDVTLRRNVFHSNSTYGHGGGLFLEYSEFTLTENDIVSNTARDGGGLCAWSSTAVLERNTFEANIADNVGGGISIWDGTYTLTKNLVTANAAHEEGGGGVYLAAEHAFLNGNVYSANQANWLGGGVYLLNSSAVLSGEIIIGNSAGNGAGLYLFLGSPTLVNSVVAENRISGTGPGLGSGLLMQRCSPMLLHTTIVGNTGGDGSGIHLVDGVGGTSTPVLINTVLVSHTVGITVSAGSTATMEATLWGSGAWANGMDWGGAGTIVTGTMNVWGDPAFVDPDSGDYHIGRGSAAIDAGVDSGVPVDMDGEPRPVGDGYDIGADEAQALVRYVATDGADSGDCSTPAGRCLTVQYAVDQAWAGDEVRVAAGVYTGVNSYGGLSQQAYISKSLTLRGGYTTTNWSASNPLSYPTTLDAERQGRVLVISGTITATVEGLRITGGDAAGLGGMREYYDLGGGVHVMTATAVLSRNWILSNTADYGGGLGLMGSHAWVSDNTFTSNTVGYEGGGLYAEGGDVVVDGNAFITNTAGWDGGGLFVYESSTSLAGNTFVENRADMWGGGVVAQLCPELTLEGNQVLSNTALQGGGLHITVISATLRGNLISANYGKIGDGGLLIGGEQVTLDSNLIVGNTTGGEAGGLSLGSEKATLSNNVIADNTALVAGGGLVILDAGYADLPTHANLVNNTIARNQAGDGTGLLVVDWFEDVATLTMTNTALVSHTVGISVSAGNTVTLQGTLWGSGAWANGVDWAGGGTILTGTVNVWGDPVFVGPAAGDYHIGPSSAAIDAGVDAGVLVDMDGEARPVGDGYDIGADEYAGGTTMLYLPLILR